MTTRITLSILLTTWAILVVGQTAAFLTARASLLALLDDTLITRATRALEAATHSSAGIGPGAASRPNGGGGAAAGPLEDGRFVENSSDEEPLLPPGDQYVIRSSAGSLVSESRGARGILRPTLTKTTFDTDPATGRRLRTIELRMFVTRDGRRIPYTITYSRPADKFDGLLSHLAGLLLLISLACGLTTAWLALKLSRAALQPLTDTADVIAQIDERQLGRRLDPGRMPAEMRPMARRLNEMLARLENVFTQRKQFLADAAHELRTPTAALLTTLEVALRRPRERDELVAAMQSGLLDARRLRKLVESLMEQARSDAPRRLEAARPTDVALLVRECAQIVEPLAREKQVTLEQDVPADELQFVTQRDRLRSVVLNLLSNAIEYNRTGGRVIVRCARVEDLAAAATGGAVGATAEIGGDGHDPARAGAAGGGAARGVEILVRDTGVGIAADQVPHVFEPFYRGGSGRGDDPAHLGLGLFLVRSHVEALDGRCQITSRLGEGTTMRVTLPERSPGGNANDGGDDGEAAPPPESAGNAAGKPSAAARENSVA
jgi:two-component system OmpR family sensor kinase